MRACAFILASSAVAASLVGGAAVKVSGCSLRAGALHAAGYFAASILLWHSFGFTLSGGFRE